MEKEKVTIKVAKTLYHNTYRCTVINEQNETKALLKVVPQLPLSREEVPENAPEVPPFLLVVVEDADIDQNNLIHFEESVSVALLNRFATDNTVPHSCQFFYPSPAFFFSDKNLQNPTPIQ